MYDASAIIWNLSHWLITSIQTKTQKTYNANLEHYSVMLLIRFYFDKHGIVDLFPDL